MTKNLWEQIEIDKPNFLRLNEDINTDIAIIGAGASGILCAYAFYESGLDVVLIDSREICSGVSSKSTAKITSQHGLIYSKLKKSLGDDLAFLYAKSNENALKMYNDIIVNENIMCDFKKIKSYLYTRDEKKIKDIEDEATDSRQFKIKASIVDNIELPFSIKGAVCFEDQGQFNPLKFFYKLAQKLKDKGNYHIYENTKAFKIEDNIIYTEANKINAKKIIVCTHFPIMNNHGAYFLKMFQERSYLIGLNYEKTLNGMYLSADDEGFSFRDYKENNKNTLLIGGMKHKTGHNKFGGNYEELMKLASELYPNSEIIYNWSAQDCIPLDNIPYIGLYSSNTPNMYVATGFKKWGMTLSMVASDVIKDLILYNKSEYKDLYDPSRIKLAASTKNFISSTKDTVKNLVKGQFTMPKDKFKDLPICHGGTVDFDGEKAGIYKNEHGEIYGVNPVCSHLGCGLQWNPDDKSWDCPCHGSRFNIDGNVIDSPAINDIDTIEII